MTEEDRPWHALDPDEVAGALDSDEEGLDADGARQRLNEHGPNELETDEGPGALAILANQFRSPLITILLVAGIVAFAVGELIDAGFIAAVLLINAGIGFFQEYKAESSIQALMELAAPSATVVRGGEEEDIDATEVVPGDLVVLPPGSRVPADVRITGADALEVDESLLTGESKVARKTPDALDPDTDLAERTNMAYMGTTVASGKGRGFAVATGMDTQLGSITESVASEEQPDTPLQQRMKRFAQVVAVTVTVAAALVFAGGLLVGADPTDMFLVAVALAVSAVPEGLPIAFTVALALGVRRMAARQAIVRRLPAVETLGSTTTIGSDKTGTLTRNEMTVEEVWAAGERWSTEDEEGEPPDSEAFRLVLLAGILTNEAELRDGEPAGDPTEVALLASADRAGMDVASLREDRPPVLEQPFDPSKLWSAAVREHDGERLLFVKGATEELLELSSGMTDAEGNEVDLDTDAVHEVMEQMADEGLRVLAMAYRRLDEAPAQDSDIEPENLTFLGLPGRRHPRRDDHRRPREDRTGHRLRARAGGGGRRGPDWPGPARAVRRRARRACLQDRGVRPHHPGAEAADRARAPGQRRGRRCDRRRRQRRPRPEGRRDRRSDGRQRHRRRPRGGRHGAD
jgi:magnesium-transporting ATPase (P-type)